MDDRIIALERELESLRARVDALAQGAQGRCSLRLHSRCPVCDHRSVLRVDRVADRGDGGSVQPLAPVIQGTWTQRAYGQFVVFVCRQCGLAEWYVAQVDDIPIDGPGVQVIEGPPPIAPAGPFR